MSASSNPITALANAIAQEEGYNVQGSLPQTLNNPGDLTANGSLLQFDSPQSGMSALIAKLQNVASGNSTTYPVNETLSQFENTYTNGDPNAASNIASILGNGTTPQTTMAALLGGTSTPASTTSPTGTATSSTASTSDVPWWQGIGQDIITGAEQAVFGGGGTLTTSAYLIRGVAILGGLVLIAGAVFGFDKVKDTAVNLTSKGAELAATA